MQRGLKVESLQDIQKQIKFFAHEVTTEKYIEDCNTKHWQDYD